MTKLRFYLEKTRSLLWLRPVILSMAAVTWVALSLFADSLVPKFWRIEIGRETLVNLFTILASSMLTVATFSVSAVAPAFSSVATSASPRATGIVMGDTQVQSTLAAFLAAFIYAVVSITALSAMTFGAAGRFMLFVGFVLLVSWVLLSFLRWVDRISKLGKLGDTLERVVKAAKLALTNPNLAGRLGGAGQRGQSRPDKGYPLISARFGYVQHVDMEALQLWAEKRSAHLWLDVRPGALLAKGDTIGTLEMVDDPGEDISGVLRCLTVGGSRSTSTDPRHAMILLAEMADRALSPAVNDPGTAISVLSIQVELFYLWGKSRLEAEAEEVKFDRVRVPDIAAEDLISDAFVSIARDGAAMVEVGVRLQKTLASIYRNGDAELRQAVLKFREQALGFSEQALILAEHRKMVSTVPIDHPA